MGVGLANVILIFRPKAVMGCTVLHCGKIHNRRESNIPLAGNNFVIDYS